MSKRKPTSELNDRNWDDEEEPEEAGSFRLAGQDVLKHRTIRKAKRTIQSESSSSGSVFAGFALKSDTSVPKPSLSTGVTLNFGTNLTVQSKANGTAQQKSSSGKSGDSTDNPEYLRQLKVLNENILSWIQKHVGENPYCILTPSFKDYEKHLGDLEKKYGVQVADTAQDKNSGAMLPPAKVTQEAAPSVFGSSGKPIGSGFTFGQSSSAGASSKSEEASSDQKADTKGVTSTGGFSFGSGSTPSAGGFGASLFKPSAGGFGGSSTAPFSFGVAAAKPSADNAAPSNPSGEAKGDGDEEYQPPKVEVREIKEDGAVYTKRCKLFYQKDGQWADRGVGNLHLKPTDDDRMQLIIRADTNLGNILLNILITSSIPAKRQGKNNVSLICVPNPPINAKDEASTKPVPMLIRVKTGEDADELLAKLDEAKNAA